MGASPEQFLKVDNDIIKTVALAGTQLFPENNKVSWKAKETQEQQIVTDFIVKVYKSMLLMSLFQVRLHNVRVIWRT